MKKIILLLFTGLVSISLFAQKTMILTNYADTLTNAETKYYYPVSTTGLITNLWSWSAQVYVDHLTGSDDSTHISWQGSIDGTTWHSMDTFLASGGTYTSTVAITQAATDSYPGLIKVSFGTTDDQFMWYPAVMTQFKYLRMKVQHFATGTVRIKAYMLVK